MTLSPSHRFDGDTVIQGSLDVTNVLSVNGTPVSGSGLAAGTVTNGGLWWNGSAWVNALAVDANIDALAVTTGKIDNLAVTSGKLAADAVTNVKVAAAAAIDESKVSISEKIGEPYCTDRGLIISGNAVVANHIRGMKYRWPKTGSVTGLAVYVIAGAAGNVTLGIYDTSATNLNLLATSASAAVGANNTWQNADMTVALPVVAGTDAYLVVHGDNASATYGRTAALASNVSQGPLPAGYMTGADGLLMRSWDFNRASYSAPLPNTIATASCSVSPPIVVYVKYA